MDSRVILWYPVNLIINSLGLSMLFLLEDFPSSGWFVSVLLVSDTMAVDYLIHFSFHRPSLKTLVLPHLFAIFRFVTGCPSSVLPSDQCQLLWCLFLNLSGFSVRSMIIRFCLCLITSMAIPHRTICVIRCLDARESSLLFFWRKEGLGFHVYDAPITMAK